MEKTSFLEMAGGILITGCSLGHAFLSFFHIVTQLQLNFKSVVLTKFTFAGIETSGANKDRALGCRELFSSL